jgi:N-acetylglucosaminyl-diphospho-decaprenol L-rhamnosyltransferase
MMPVTAILVTYNSAAVIADALASLPAGVPAVVVDNASTDDSAVIAERAGATVIRMERNIGFGAANNIGLSAARTDFVALVNPDAVLRPGCLEAIVRTAESHPEAALFLPVITTSKGTFTKHHSILTPSNFAPGPASPGITRIGFASGGVFVARRNVMDDLGGFDDAIFLYFEDDDLSRRVIDAGHAILLVDAAEAGHIGNVSSPPSPALTYMKHWHLAWSERYVCRKFGLAAPGYWRIAESLVKLLWSQVSRNRMEEAKQLGLINGTFGHMRGLKASEVRDNLVMEPE